MLTKFDKAFAGGGAAWVTQGLVAGLEALGLPPVPDQMEVWIATVVAGAVVYLFPNKV